MTLPNGWLQTTLGKAALPAQKRVNPKDFPDLPYIGMENIEAHTMRLLGTVPAKEMRSTAESFEAGDVLYGRLRPYLNKVYSPDFHGLCSTEFIVFRKTPLIYSKYLQYFLNSWDFVTFANSLNAGDRPRVKFEQLADYPFPIAPYSEQERIVERIESLVTQLEAGVAGLKRAQAALKRYRASVLKVACEGRLFGEVELKKDDLPVGWQWITVGEITESMNNGIYKKAEYYTEDGTGVACLRMYNIEDGEIVWKDIKRMLLSDDEIQTYKLLPGDILVNRVNSRELVGKSAVIPEGLESTVYESKNIRLRLNNIIANSKFVNYWFRLFSRQYFNFNAQQVVGMASINQVQLGAMPLPLPPIEEQQRIVEEVERRLSVVAELEVAVSASLRRAGRLRQAILKQAFEGRLVAQEAEKMLESIEGDQIVGTRNRAEQLPLPGISRR